jgi:hypothetical protein
MLPLLVYSLELFYDLEIMFRLSCIVPLLEGLNELIKFSQSDNVLYVILLLLRSCSK